MIPSLMLEAKDDPRSPGTLWVLNLDWPAPHDASPRVPAVFRRVDADQVGPLAQAMGAADPAEVGERFTSGRRCYAAYVEGALAAYGWVSFGEEWIGELQLRLRLAQGEAYVWDCATAPAYRRRRLYTALLIHIAGELRAEGLCRVWIGADQDNAPSQGGFELAGFKPIADLVVERAPGAHSMRVRGRPGVPEWLVTDARRALLGDRDRAWLAALGQPGHAE